MEKVALLVLFNHRYDKNIPKLEELYRNKFSYIFFLVPFYDGNKENVIPVYGHSHNFATYISQAYTHLKGKGFTHYFVVADDMIINPAIDEHQLWDATGIGKDECYLPDFWNLIERKRFWAHSNNALGFKLNSTGLELGGTLPTKEEAEARFNAHGVRYGKIPLKAILPKKILSLYFFKQLFFFAESGFSREPKYPIVAGYSDILLLTEDVMPKFCQYVGAFSAAGLFVEIAIPTSFVLCVPVGKLKTNKTTILKGGDVWTEKEKTEIIMRYEGQINKLINNYPKDKLYIHPIKLSQWQK